MKLKPYKSPRAFQVRGLESKIYHPKQGDNTIMTQAATGSEREPKDFRRNLTTNTKPETNNKPLCPEDIEGV